MMSDQKKEVKSFPELLRDALQSLNSDDDDRATEKNHVGFNKDDGDPARALLNKEKWNDEDLKEAFRIASHYKKTQLKDRWSGILESRKRYFEDIKKEKKPDGWWTPIEFENDVPIAYAGWFEGKPYKLKITESSDDVLEKRQKITLRNHDDEQIQSKIKRLMIDGTDMVEFEEEVFTKTEFVNLMVKRRWLRHLPDGRYERVGELRHVEPRETLFDQFGHDPDNPDYELFVENYIHEKEFNRNLGGWDSFEESLTEEEYNEYMDYLYKKYVE